MNKINKTGWLVIVLLLFSVKSYSITRAITLPNISITAPASVQLPSEGGYINLNVTYYIHFSPDEDTGIYIEQMNESLSASGSLDYLQVQEIVSGWELDICVSENLLFEPLVLQVSGEKGGFLTITLAPAERPVEPDPDSDPRFSISGNWKLERTYIKEDNTTHYQDITFYNGLGYAEQIINVGAGAVNGKNIVTSIVYDAGLREDARTYLPYISSNNSLIREADPVAGQVNYYNNLFGATVSGGYSYVEKVYEPSPLNRPLEQHNAGKVFRDRSKKSTFTYATNVANEVFRLDISGTAVRVNYYPAASLYKNTLTNEDNTSTTTYTDLTGKTILERTTGAGVNQDTYYGYDSFGRLAVVITPQGAAALTASSTALNFSGILLKEYAYTYLYDGIGRLIEKKAPGRDVEYYVYDKGHRLVMSQDGNLRTNNRWIYNVYDNNNRLIEVSIVQGTLTRYQIQERYQSGLDNTYPTLGGTDNINKPFNSKEFSVVKVLSRARYGGNTYITNSSVSAFTIPAYLSFQAVANVVTAAGVDAQKSTNNKVYEVFALLDNSGKEVERAFYYDYQGRVIQTVEKNHLGGISRTSCKYDFTGNILSLHESHQNASGAAADTKLTTSTYDTRGRLTAENTTVNGVSASSAYTYNDLGQLIRKTYGGITENLSYNLQGWLTSQSASNTAGNLYNQQLKYYDPAKAAALFTGNISEWSWQHQTKASNTYGFTYDGFARLTAGKRYAGNTEYSSYTERGITYDRNGNITALQRYEAALKDNFTYTYAGNRLTGLSGSINAAYTYDNNGNMLTDGRKNLQILYNVLNLPECVKQNGTTQATYVYLADGTKAEVYTGSSQGTGTGYTYLGSLRYTKTGTNRRLESTPFGAGRFVNNTGGMQPYYHITDHLGSVRVITDKNGTVQEQNDYYPYGGRHTSGNTYAALPGNNHKFNGKEEQTTANIGYLDYGARMYDNVTGRWFVQDPLAEQRYWVSSYNFVQNNPVNRIDPNGMIDDWVEDKEKNIYWDTKAKSQATTKEGERYLGAAVVVFNGSRNERLGEGDNLFGKGAVLADVTVYGPKGSEDIEQYKGFTMSSDASLYGVVADGNYMVNKLKSSDRKGPYDSVWTLNNRGNVPALDGINPAYPLRNPGYLNGVFIHRSNNDGFAGKRWDTSQNKYRAVSQGCLLISPKQWEMFNKQLSDIELFYLQITRK